MVYCTVINCKHSSNKRYGNRISFYRLPKEPEVRKLWIETLKKRKVPRSENSIRICNVHFEKSCFERDLKNELLNLPTRRILKKGAVPTIFPKAEEASKLKATLENQEFEQLVEVKNSSFQNLSISSYIKMIENKRKMKMDNIEKHVQNLKKKIETQNTAT